MTIMVQKMEKFLVFASVQRLSSSPKVCNNKKILRFKKGKTDHLFLIIRHQLQGEPPAAGHSPSGAPLFPDAHLLSPTKWPPLSGPLFSHPPSPLARFSPRLLLDSGRTVGPPAVRRPPRRTLGLVGGRQPGQCRHSLHLRAGRPAGQLPDGGGLLFSGRHS